MPPMRIREPVNPDGIIVDKKVVSKVGIPDENWESEQPAEFVVAPLTEHDAILGVPFLAEEGILVDPARRTIILPQDQLGSQDLEPSHDTDNISTSPSSQESNGGADIPLQTEAMMDQRKEMKDKWELREPSLPSICPKVTTSRKIVAPEPELGWIKALQEFEASRPHTAELQQYLARFNGTLPSNPTERNEYFAKINEYFVRQYNDVFTGNLPDYLPHPDAPRH